MPDSGPIHRRSIEQRPFDADALPFIAELLGTSLRPASFRLPDGDVFQFDLPSADGGGTLTVTLWPSIRRVDANAPGLTVVTTNVATVSLVEGVEVLFRREQGEYLIVTRAGKVIVRA